MNKKVYKTLEYNKILTMLSSYAACDETKKRCLSLEPITDLYEIRHLQTTTADALSRLYKDSGVSFVGIHNVHASLKRLDIGGALNTTELLRICSLLEVAKRVKAYGRSAMDNEKQDSLSGLFAGIEPVSALCDEIKRCILSEEEIADDASPELFKIRKSIRGMNDRIHAQLTKLMNNSTTRTYLQDAVVTMRDGRYCLPVKAEAKGNVPGMMHDQSSTGSTLFIEPMAVVNLNNELKELQYEERREIVRILTRFTDAIRPDLPDIRRSGDFLTTMDFIRAKARFALANDCTMPIVERAPQIGLKNARHTLLAQTLRREGKPIVPLELTLTPQKHILVISGPNAGGKSVCLKTVGLLQYMMQKGFLISASENSEMGLFDDLFIDIGDEQSIDNDLSTYSSHLLNMKNILRGATGRSLVLIDEFGTGTEPVIGGAIAEAVLEKLEQKRCFGVITTHYSNLKYYASNAEGILNGAMTFDVQNIRPLFRLETGKPGSSFAIEIARKIGLPEEIIRNAADKAGSDHVNIERQLREIARDRRYWEQKRDKIRQTEKRVDELAEKYRSELEAIQAERNRLIKEAKSEAKQITSEANRQIEQTIRTIRESQADKEKTLLVRRKMDDFRERLEQQEADSSLIDRKIEQLRRREERRSERKNAKTAGKQAEQPKEAQKPRAVEPGTKVRIKGQDAVGEVIGLSGKRATVGFGQILTTIDLNRLEPISNAEYKKATRELRPAAPPTNFSTAERRLQFHEQIDVRGMRVAEAVETVQDFVDEAIMLGFSEIRILHGKGTGALKEEIRSYLRTVPLVRSAKDEHEEMGGAGITVVKLDI